MSIVDLEECADHEDDLSSCQHRDILLFVRLSGHLNLSFELKVEAKVSKLIWLLPSADPLSSNLAYILAGRSLPTVQWRVEDESIP